MKKGDTVWIEVVMSLSEKFGFWGELRESDGRISPGTQKELDAGNYGIYWIRAKIIRVQGDSYTIRYKWKHPSYRTLSPTVMSIPSEYALDRPPSGAKVVPWCRKPKYNKTKPFNRFKNLDI